MKPNTIFLVVAGIAVLAGLYWYFFTGSPPQAPLSATPASQNQAQAQFEVLIGQLEPISFDLAILSDPRFTALVDLSTPVAPEPVSRADPFAPIGAAPGK